MLAEQRSSECPPIDTVTLGLGGSGEGGIKGEN